MPCSKEMENLAVKLNTKYLEGFVAKADVDAISPEVASAVELLNNRTGAGNDFLGWLDLPVDYNKEEFERIKKAAAKIRNDSDVLIVIGIGGSYLGARAAIEFCKSQNYNCFSKPQIFFAGNTISSSALAEAVKLCEGKDFSVNVISKSGTTTEPTLAFRVFKELLEEKYGKDSSVLEKTLAAALLYTPDEETEWNAMLAEKGYEGILTELAGLDPNSAIFARVLNMAKTKKIL